MKKIVTLFLLIIITIISPELIRGAVIRNDFRVNQDTTRYTQIGYSVGFDGHGNFVVAYQDNGLLNKNHQIYFARFDSLGNPIGSPVLVSDTNYLNSAADVAVHSSGRFVITWWKQWLRQDILLVEDDIYAQIFDSLGNPLSPRLQVDVNRPTVQEDEWAQEGFPRVGMDNQGNFVVVWQTQNGPAYPLLDGIIFLDKGFPQLVKD